MPSTRRQDRAAVRPFPEAGPAADRERFELSYRACREPLVRLCRARFGAGDEAEAIAQEAFAKAWASRERLSDEGSLWPLLVTIARRLCINESSTRTRRSARLAALAPVAWYWHIDDELDRTAHSPDVDRALHRIPLRSRRQLLLRDVEGWSYSEIARFEGVTVDSVRGAIKRARQQFRSAYQRSTDAFGAAVLAVGGLARRLGARTSGNRHCLEGLGARLAHPEAVALVAMMLAWTAQGATPVERTETVAITPATTTTTASGAGGSGEATGTTPGPQHLARPAVAPTAIDESHEEGDSAWGELYASPSYAEDQTVFTAATSSSCASAIDCDAVVMRSTDGARSWQRLRAAGLKAKGGRVSLLLPPAFPRDNRIFALAGDLFVSTDGGDTFSSVAPSFGFTLATMSPLFSAGDPRIVMSSLPVGNTPNALVAYRYGDPAPAPLTLPLPPSAQPFSLVFGPTYEADGTMLVSVIEARTSARPFTGPTGAWWNGAVYSCTTSTCRRVVDLGTDAIAPKVQWGPHLAEPVVVVSTPTRMFRSTDRGQSFQAVSRPVHDDASQMVREVATGPAGRLFAVTTGGTLGMTTRLYTTADGDTWSTVPGLGRFAIDDALVLSDGTILVVGRPLDQPGPSTLRCSRDGGRSWAPTCPPG